MDRLKSEEIFKRFLKDCEVRGMSPRTMPGYKSALKMFGKYLSQANVDILDVNRDVLRGFIEHIRGKGLSQRSLKSSFSHVKPRFKNRNRNQPPPFRALLVFKR